MLAVDRQEPDMLATRHRGHELAGHHHHFLRRKRDVHSLRNRRDRGPQSRHPDGRDKADVRLVLLDGPESGVLAHVRLRPEFAGDLLASLLGTESRHRDDREVVPMSPDNVDRARSDRSRRAENDDSPSHGGCRRFRGERASSAHPCRS